ncbi:hypothetical protein [Brucella anthropi]|uniref:hypothetical protein n=1 Tax=Brucella anthropi TaxID=529 RepID=UPI00320B0929
MVLTAKQRVDVFLPFAEESVLALKLIHETHIPTIAMLLSFCITHHPREVATKYRKRGEQLTTAEKQALGLRSNAFFSRDALNALTDKGRLRPKDSFETTLLRGVFSHSRARSIGSTTDVDHAYLKYSSMFNDCPTCKQLDDTKIDIETAAWQPPSGCIREVCGIQIRMNIDFLAAWDE